MNTNPCKCGKPPTLRTIDVASTALAHYLRCECGRATSWKFTADQCAAEWNKANPIQPKPVQSSHAMSVLMRKKGEMAYAG